MPQLVSASSSLAATTLLLLLSAAAAAAAAPLQAQAGTACHNDIIALRTTCYEFVQEGGRALPPSSNCCATLMGLTNVPCVCDYLGSDFDVDLDKVFYVGRHCGVAIPRGCGGPIEQKGIVGSFKP
ncbi:hypothetical protein PAHAL_9G281400 [Panicum hallii]|uniref:Bifunctional inhibitor/plant lipid transfer protein/seed storage helical domain-containing protein n=2 Tax=Panicum sect. Panicum TaxID=2100772 RepID=A0A3L6SCX5_PANMI|nr:hypothetical protein PAHAL_9G281400 [Panicum hallii]RLN18788.1 hypothetical protein C2845_PM02G16450 [Panicum miliaceum]